MRAFLGIPLPPPDPLAKLLEELRACGADLKVVQPHNLHITLKFLGEIPEAQAPLILEHLRKAPLPRDYPLVLHDVGAFPDWKRLNILWVGLRDPDGALATSFAITERALAEIGFPPEMRPFAPHATLARKRSDRGRERAKEILSRRRNETFGELRVRGPILFRSMLSPLGPTYEALGEALA